MHRTVKIRTHEIVWALKIVLSRVSVISNLQLDYWRRVYWLPVLLFYSSNPCPFRALSNMQFIVLASQPPPYSRRGVNKSMRVHPSFTRVIIESAPELIEGLTQYSQEILRSSYHAFGSISRSAFEAKMLCIQANSGNAVVRRGA